MRSAESKKSLRERLAELPPDVFELEGVSVRPIQDEEDVWYAVVECQLAPGQEQYVNPAGFSLGRAWLYPANNVPCVIRNENGERIGFLILCRWPEHTGWGYFLDRNRQGCGYGVKAAQLAVAILRAAEPELPIKLSVEMKNVRAQHLYERIGFRKTSQLDGDDLVFTI